MHTIAIYFDEANRVYVFCSDGQERCRSDTRIRHFSSPEKTCSANKRRIRESDLRLLRCFALGLENKIRPSEEMFQRCRSDTRIRHFPSSGKLVLRTSVGFENPTYAYCVVLL